MRLTFLVASLSFAFAVGCASNDTSGDDDGSDAPDCSTVTGTDTFTVGLEKMGAAGNADFKLMSIAPAPVIRGDNTWVVQINSMANNVVGSPMDGATVTGTPYMPAHQHGSPIIAAVTPTGNPGEYSIAPINMWMPGIWQTTVAVTSGSTSDRAVFAFCVN
jgi:YtkA-like